MVQRGIILLFVVAAAMMAFAQDSTRDSSTERRSRKTMSDDSPMKSAVPHHYRDTTGDAAVPGGGENVRIDTLHAISDIVYRHLPELAPQGYILQKQVRNAYQRSAYENIVFDIVGGDGLSAIFQYLKLKLNVAFAMEHKRFVVLGNPALRFDGVTLPDDWNFPPDPYIHAWWRH